MKYVQKFLYLIWFLVCVELLCRCVFLLPFDDLFSTVYRSSGRQAWLKHHQNHVEIYYSFDAFDRTKGWALKPNVRLKDAAGELSSNSKGIRGTKEHAYEKSPGKLRILTFGDSFTFGDEVSDDQTYPAILEKMVPSAEVINFGVHGYGHDQMLIYLKEEGVKYHPDIVVLGFVDEDVYRNLMDFRDYAKPRFVLKNGKLELKGGTIPAPEALVRNEIFRSKFLDLLNILYVKFLWRSGIYQREAKKVTRAILNEFAETVRGVGAVPIFVFLPTQGITAKHADFVLREEAFFTSYCKETRVDCLSTTSFFRLYYEQGGVFKDYAHYSPERNGVVAFAIEEYLKTRVLKPNG